MTSGGDWVEQARRLMEGLRAAVPASPESPAAGDPASAAAGSDCRWCPLCQAAAVVRGERPELTAALADILAATSAALRQFAGEPATEPEPAPDQPPATPAPPVQRIELS
jgi:hypothetical protein